MGTANNTSHWTILMRPYGKGKNEQFIQCFHKITNKIKKYLYNLIPTNPNFLAMLAETQLYFLARRDECPESYCRTPGVSVGVHVYKNFNLAYNSWTTIGRAFIFHMYSLWQDLSMGTKIFDLVTLTLKFDLLSKKLKPWSKLPNQKR